MNTPREKEIYKVTIVGTIANIILLGLKFFAGIVSNSAAMIADAVHSLSDFLTDIVVVVFVKISSKKEDKDHNYGHGKFETLSTVIIGLVLLTVGIGIMKNAGHSIYRVIKGEILEAPGWLALIAALVSILVKEALYRYTMVTANKVKSDAVKANAWHHRSDAFSSIGTALGVGGAIILGNKWTILDPIAALIVSFFIIKIAIQLSKSGIDELMEKSLPEAVENEIKEIILSVPGVNNPHHLKTRKIGNVYSIVVHVCIDGNLSLEEAHDLALEVEEKLKEKYGQGTYIAVHMDPTNQCD